MSSILREKLSEAGKNVPSNLSTTMLIKMYDKLTGGFNVLKMLLPNRNKDYFSPKKEGNIREHYLEGDFSKKIIVKKK